MIANRRHGLEYRAMRSAAYACTALGILVGRFVEFWWVGLTLCAVMVAWHGFRYVTREADQP